MLSDNDNLVSESKWWQKLDHEEFQQRFHMSQKTFTTLQAEIDDIKGKHNEDIDTRLLATVWILGNSEPIEEANALFNIDDNILEILKEQLVSILELADSYITWPSLEEALLIEKGFAAQYSFPTAIGALGYLYIDVNVEKEINQKTYYNPLTSKPSIVLQVVCDNNLLLRDVCAGFPASKGLQDILSSSPLFRTITDSNSLLIKHGKHLLGGTEHPELKNLLTPYKTKVNGTFKESEYEFNVVHNSAMDVVEETFRCLENRFPRITNVYTLTPELATLIVSASCVLHNFTNVYNDNCHLYN